MFFCVLHEHKQKFNYSYFFPFEDFSCKEAHSERQSLGCAIVSNRVKSSGRSVTENSFSK